MPIKTTKFTIPTQLFTRSPAIIIQVFCEYEIETGYGGSGRYENQLTRRRRRRPKKQKQKNRRPDMGS